ncbi:hypothetical protein NL676_017981 [Syzygium grande]|nr:hypothetical protein NL676_017981 [Syzygium grande]
MKKSEFHLQFILTYQITGARVASVATTAPAARKNSSSTEGFVLPPLLSEHHSTSCSNFQGPVLNNVKRTTLLISMSARNTMASPPQLDTSTST